MTKEEFDKKVDEKFKDINNYVYNLNSNKTKVEKEIYYNSFSYPEYFQNGFVTYNALYYLDTDFSNQVNISSHLPTYKIFNFHVEEFIKNFESNFDEENLNENDVYLCAMVKSLKIDLNDYKSKKEQIRKFID